MKDKTLRNGTFVSSQIATDRSLLYGDGIFTTIAINNGRPLFLKQHLDRLVHDGQKLKINHISLASIETALFKAIQGLDYAIARITISRSSGERGYLCTQGEPVYWITVSDWPVHIEKFRKLGIRVRICQQRLASNPSLAGIKHCNRLEQVLARNEWHTDNYQEGLMLDSADNVLEGTMSNLFLIKEGKMLTPDLTFAGVEGIIRALIIDIAKQQNIPLTIARVSRQDIETAEALFVTNSVIGIWPITQLDEHYFNQHPMLQLLADELGKLGLK